MEQRIISGVVMDLRLTIQGKARIVEFYDVSKIGALDSSSFDLAQRGDVSLLFEQISELIESAEADQFEAPLYTIHGVVPEGCEITLNNDKEHRLTLDDVTLENRSAEKYHKMIECLPDRTPVFIKMSVGDALWDFDAEGEDKRIDPSNLSLGYLDCSKISQYDAMGSGLYEILCDTVVTDGMHYDGSKFELMSFVEHDMQVFGSLFIVRETKEAGIKTLLRVDVGGKEMADDPWSELSDLKSSE
jgi:hypothetical protein